MQNPTFPSRVCLLSLTLIFFGVLLSGCGLTAPNFAPEDTELNVIVGRDDANELEEDARVYRLRRSGPYYKGLDEVMSEYFHKDMKETDNFAGYYIPIFLSERETNWNLPSKILRFSGLACVFGGPPFATDIYYLSFKLSFRDKNSSSCYTYSDSARFEIPRKLYCTENNTQNLAAAPMTRLVGVLNKKINKDTEKINGCLDEAFLYTSSEPEDGMGEKNKDEEGKQKFLSSVDNIEEKIAQKRGPEARKRNREDLYNMQVDEDENNKKLAEEYEQLYKETKKELEDYIKNSEFTKANGSIPTNIDTKSKSGNTWIAVSLDVLGIAGLSYGFYQNSKANDFSKEAKKLKLGEPEYNAANKKIDDAKTKRNAGFIIGSILLASGITMYIWF